MRRTQLIGGLAAALAILASPAAAEVRFHGEGAGAAMRVMSWRDIPFRTVVRQQFDYSCGSAALATLLTYHYKTPTTEAAAFKAMYATGDKEKIRKVGFSMLDMKRYLETKGLKADGYRITLPELARRQTPAIALIDLGRYRHFVVIKGVQGDKVLLGDPAKGLRSVPIKDFQKMWNGIVFTLHGQAPAFNVASEWAPWAPLPMKAGQSAAPDLANITRDQLPLYQISPVRTVESF